MCRWPVLTACLRLIVWLHVGDFTAPYTGKYIVMANVRFDNVPINGVYTMIIAINGNTGNVDNGVKSVRGTKSITAAKVTASCTRVVVTIAVTTQCSQYSDVSVC